MASPINTFKSIAVDVTVTPSVVYTAPSETTTIVLMAQAVNVSTSNIGRITFYTSINSNTELVKNFEIPVGDSAALLSGKFVIEEGESIGVYADDDGVLKLTLSILETR